MKKASIAYCIPTYNHPEAIQAVMGKIAALYKEYEIDIYLYDSSEGDETKDIVTSFMEHGYDHIYYIRLSSSISPEDKAILFLSGYGFKKQYDYIWPVKDREYFGEETIRAIDRELEYGYDAIFLAVAFYPWELQEPDLDDIIYEEPECFFYDWGWLATSLEATLFRYDTILKDVDWQKFKDDYFINGRNAFVHFVRLFTGLAELKKPRVKVLCGKHICAIETKLANSSWTNQALTIWAYLWPKEVNLLPHCYDKAKKKVIKQTAMLPWLLGSHNSLQKFKQAGALTYEIFEDYRSIWPELSDIPEEDVDLILEGNFDKLLENIKNELQEMLFREDYEKAYILYWLNPRLSEYMGNRDYKILNNCFQIYKTEIDRGKHSEIFNHMQKLEDVLEKYKSIKYFLRRMEYGIREDMQQAFISNILEWDISGEFQIIVVLRECINQERVMSRLQQCLNEVLI